MSWLFWAVLSAVFAAATALLAKAGVSHVDPNLATAIRTTVVVVFAWLIAIALGGHHEIATVDRSSPFCMGASGNLFPQCFSCTHAFSDSGPDDA